MARVNLTGWSVRIGEKGPHVELAQCLLNKWVTKTQQVNLTAIVVDGKAGPASHDRIMQWQTYERLEDDGTIGPISWPKLVEYADPVDAATPETAVAPMLPPQMRIKLLDVTPDGQYADQIALFAKAANLVIPLFCVYWRCNVTVEVGDFDSFDPDKHVALLFGPDAGGVDGAAGWHWHGPIQAVLARLGIPITDDDNDPVAWVDMSSFRPDVTFFHELWELIVNPFISMLVQRLGDPYYWMLENCDATQSDFFQVIVDGRIVNVANFFGPNWAGNGGETGFYGMASEVIDRAALVRDFALGMYDAMGLMTRPFDVRLGGYQIKISTTDPNNVQYVGAFGEPVTPPAHAARRLPKLITSL